MREEFIESACDECHRALWEKDGPICEDCIIELTLAAEAAGLHEPVKKTAPATSDAAVEDKPATEHA